MLHTYVTQICATYVINVAHICCTDDTNLNRFTAQKYNRPLTIAWEAKKAKRHDADKEEELPLVYAKSLHDY